MFGLTLFIHQPKQLQSKKSKIIIIIKWCWGVCTMKQFSRNCLRFRFNEMRGHISARIETQKFCSTLHPYLCYTCLSKQSTYHTNDCVLQTWYINILGKKTTFGIKPCCRNYCTPKSWGEILLHDESSGLAVTIWSFWDLYSV